MCPPPNEGGGAGAGRKTPVGGVTGQVRHCRHAGDVGCEAQKEGQETAPPPVRPQSAERDVPCETPGTCAKSDQRCIERQCRRTEVRLAAPCYDYSFAHHRDRENRVVSDSTTTGGTSAKGPLHSALLGPIEINPSKPLSRATRGGLPLRAADPEQAGWQSGVIRLPLR